MAHQLQRIPGRAIRLLIAGGSAMDCQLLQTALKPFRRQFEVAFVAASRNEILRCFSAGNIDVALINVDLEDGQSAGVEILSELHASYPQTALITLMNTWQDELLLHAFRGGAKGVFSRSEEKLEVLCKCIRAVYEGQVWANSDQLQVLLKALVRGPMRAVSSTGRRLLSGRELEVANLVAEGLPNKEIAQRLGITEHTVSNYLFRMYNKLGISSRVELVLYVTKQLGRRQAVG